jgi:hypothetical protein
MSSEWLHVGARIRGPASNLGRRLFPFVELQLAMALGALACLLVGRVARASPIYATDYKPGTVPYFLGDVFFLTVPVVIWIKSGKRRLGVFSQHQPIGIRQRPMSYRSRSGLTLCINS